MQYSRDIKLSDIAPPAFAAFTKPLASNKSRYLFPGPGIYFRDLPPSESPADDQLLKIERKFLNHECPKVDRILTMDRISLWCKENSIDIYILTRKGSTERLQDIKERINGPEIRDTTRLHRLIRLLRKEDLNRITMPLDTVAHLLRSRD